MNYQTKATKDKTLLNSFISSHDEMVVFSNVMQRIQENYYNNTNTLLDVSVGIGNIKMFDSILSSHTEKPNAKLTTFENEPCFILFDDRKPIMTINLSLIKNIFNYIDTDTVCSRYTFIFDYNNLSYKVSVSF